MLILETKYKAKNKKKIRNIEGSTLFSRIFMENLDEVKVTFEIEEKSFKREKKAIPPSVFEEHSKKTSDYQEE